MLFDVARLNHLTLKNRVVMAPMTRARSSRPAYLPSEFSLTYYEQRSNAGLIISEPLVISPTARGYANTPGIYTNEQIVAWQPITRQVKKQGTQFFAQLWHCGRVSSTNVTGCDHTYGPSAIKGINPIMGYDGEDLSIFLPTDMPKALTIDELRQIQDDYAQAAENAIKAGFDGIEVHAGHGYLPEQFLNRESNHRDDQYGGTIRNRIRFIQETVEKISQHIGENKVAIRFSPFISVDYQNFDLEQPNATIELLKQLDTLSLAYVHISEEILNAKPVPDIFRRTVREAFKGTIIVAGGYDKEKAEAIVSNGLADLVAFGSAYIANPDLVSRMKKGQDLAQEVRSLRYGGGEKGYIDYPNADGRVQN